MNATPPACIGVFDSGVGGLSVLRALQRRLPRAPLHYIADSAHAPYGELPVQRIVQRSERLTQALLQQGARLVVVACNTATAVALDLLRERFPHVLFVGVEPGVKPAVLLSSRARIAVLGTPTTVASARLRSLVERHAKSCQVELIGCPGLADLVEAGLTDVTALSGAIDAIVQAVRRVEADTVVLGCTHYPFVAAPLQAALGRGIRLVDTADAVAEQTARLWTGPSADSPPPVRLYSSGDTATLQRLAAQWLQAPIEVRSLPTAP